jgi:hypothetical protein
MVGAELQPRLGINLGEGTTDVTEDLIGNEIDCEALAEMSNTLQGMIFPDLGDPGTYASAAQMRAHEMIHIEQRKAAILDLFAVFLNAINNLSVPLASAETPEDAYLIFFGNPPTSFPLVEYSNAYGAFLAGISAHNSAHEHIPEQAFKDAEKAVVDQLVDAIESQRAHLNCP